MQAGIGVTFIGYFVVLTFLAAWAWRATRNVDDYVLGGRRLGAAVAALSAGASDMSGWLLLGLPGAIFVSGLDEAWIMVGLVVGAWCNWSYVAPRLRRFSGAGGTDSLTLPQFIARRFADDTPAIRVTATVVILVFFTIYTASGFVAGAKLFMQIVEVEYVTALLIGAALMMLYTSLGGFLGVSWTDFFQALLMVIALVLVPTLAFMELETPAPAPSRSDITVIAWLSSVAWGLGYFGQPHILVRFMAIRSATIVPRARRIGMTWMVISGAGAVAVGLIGHAWFSGNPAVLSDPETVFIALSEALLQPWLTGLVLAAILAAVMSTVDSQLLVASTSLVQDLGEPLFSGASDRTLMIVSRIGVLAIALIAGVLAADPGNRVLALVAYAWAGLGASLGPVVLMSLFWPRMTGRGAIAGMVVGAVTVLVWRPLEGGLLDLYEILPAFLAAVVAIVGVSLLDPAEAPAAVFEDLLAGDGESRAPAPARP